MREISLIYILSICVSLQNEEYRLLLYFFFFIHTAKDFISISNVFQLASNQHNEDITDFFF